MPLTPSEVLVSELCRRSFLTLWSEANPITRPGKELCDLLVVCAPDVVIFSVKEIALKDSGSPTVDWQRWRRRAIDDSVKQLYGAERWVRSTSRVIRADGSLGLMLPPPDRLRVHRVAVALGGRGAVPYFQGDFGKGFVHVLDEVALRTVLTELDTITDFVDYLTAKEALVRTGAVPFMEGQEEDLLAFYIHQGRQFPRGPDLIVVGDNLWKTLVQKPEWQARKEADRESYVWDGLIETLRESCEVPGASPSDALDALDGALAIMARENRFARRILAHGFNEFMRDAAEKRTRARIMPSLSGVHYVFLASDHDEDREARRAELALRCFIARGRKGMSGDTVVGIATERYAPNAGFSMDAVRLTKPKWTTHDQQALEGIQRDLGYFVKPVMSRLRGDEFPKPGGSVWAAGRNDPCPCGSGRKYKKCHGAPK
jgi:hypothetical protein